MDDAGEIAAALRPPGLEALRVLGPAPAPLGRLKGEYRAQLFLKGTQRNAMREALLDRARQPAGPETPRDCRRGSDERALTVSGDDRACIGHRREAEHEHDERDEREHAAGPAPMRLVSSTTRG